MKEEEQAESNIFKVTENIFSGILDIASLFTKTGKALKLLNSKNNINYILILFFVICLCAISILMFSLSIKSISTDNTYGYMIYHDFVDSGIPHLSPFGGAQYQIITADFHDIKYYQHYGRWHQGMDLVPNQKYYQEDSGYLDYKDVLVYATCSGNAKSLVDSAGANYIYLICDGGQYALFFVHNKYNLIEKNHQAKVIAGQPIAVMGNTGNSFGAHVHYAIKDLKTNSFLDPKLFMN